MKSSKAQIKAKFHKIPNDPFDKGIKGKKNPGINQSVLYVLSAVIPNLKTYKTLCKVRNLGAMLGIIGGCKESLVYDMVLTVPTRSLLFCILPV